MSHLTTRRSLLGLIPAWLALPRPCHATEAAAAPRVSVVPTPLDLGEDGPPKAVRVLDPLDPVAIELGRLYDILRSTHPAEIKAKRALLEHDDLGEPIPAATREWKEHCVKREPLYEEDRDRERLRRSAYFNLMHSVIDAHGGGTPWLGEWYSYGTAHRVVRVGDRIYSVCGDYDAEWPENEDERYDDDGMVVLSVVDL